MKKSLLLVATLAMSSAVFAQWTKPTVQGQAMAVNDTVYLYNVGTNSFFLGANDYNTRASVGSRGYKVIIKEAFEDEEKTVPMGTFLICDSVETQQAVKCMFCDNPQSIWVDNNNGLNVDQWLIEATADGSYKISNKGTANADYKGTSALSGMTLGVAEKYEGKTGNTRLWLKDPALKYDDGSEEVEIFDGEFYDKWLFVSPEEYAQVQPKIDQYNAAMSLKDALDAAKAEYAKCDFSSVDAVYQNTASTVEELEAAEKQIQLIITEYKASLASFDEPLDLTDVIGNGADVGPWTQEFADDKKVGVWHTNTWSTEADGGADGTDMVKPFCEDWVANGSILSDQKVYQVLKNAAPGLYKFEANVRLYNEKGDVEALTGCNMYFGDQKVTLDEQVDMFKSGNKCVLWSKNKFHIIAIVKEAGDVEFGFDIKDATFNWMAFKETTLTYYGNENCEANAVKLIKESYSFSKRIGADANKEYIDAFNNAVDAFDAAVTADEINAAAAKAEAAETALDANIAAYNNLKDKIKSWEKAVSEKQDLTGSEWDDFSDFVQSEDEIDNYPTPNPVAINDGDRSLTTEEITSYIAKVEELFASAVAHSLTEGADCTDMLVNPKFTDPNGTGWTVGGNCTNKALRGGLHNFPVAESWHSTFDIYQEIDGVPDGIYSLSLNGFCRLDDGETEVAAEIYMNEFATGLQEILAVDQMVAQADAKDGFNCYLSNDAEGAWTTNPIFQVEDAEGNITACGHNSPNNATDTQTEIDGVVYYSPNGMEGASVAFSAGRYEAKVYGLVEGGKMKLGIRNTKSTHQWALWSNFTLTYEGKSKDALLSLVPQYIEKLQDYLSTNADAMTDPGKTTAESPIADAQNAVSSKDAEAMYQALSAINAAYVSATENAAAVAAFNTAEGDINEALEGGNYTQEAAKAYEDIADRIDAYNTLTTAELKTLVDDMNEVAKMLRIPATDDASDENPADMTAVIVNSDFSAGNADGWTYQFAAISNIGYQSANYSGDEVTIDQFIEGWRSGNAPIGDGTIEQTIEKLPAGVYELTVDAIATQQSGQSDDPEADNYYEKVSGGIYLFASEEDGAKSATEIKTANGKPEQFSVIFKKASADSKVTIGVQALESTSNWIAADNWTLSYFGTESAKEITGDATDAVAIAGVTTAKPATAAIYNAAGARINKLQKGLNIVRMADGSIKKVLVK